MARTCIMGILNVTPDSFSDGGLFIDPDSALRRAEKMLSDGADILDIGGESTRPATFSDNAPLSAEEEMRRILPVIRALAREFPRVPISIDTYKAEVAEAALQEGATMINDISALRADPRMAATVAKSKVPVCLMHLLGTPRNIPKNPVYSDVVLEVRDHLLERAEFAISSGIAKSDIILDPGFGFGKTVAQNLELLRRLPELTSLGYPLLLGTSRKSTLGVVLDGSPPEERIEGSAATVALGIAYGASIVRVHDVRELSRVAKMTDAVVRGFPFPKA